MYALSEEGAHTLYKKYHFPTQKSIQGVGNPKSANFEHTYLRQYSRIHIREIPS